MKVLTVKRFPNVRKNRDRILFSCICVIIVLAVSWLYVDNEIENLKNVVRERNKNQQIKNLRKFEELRNDSIVIVVQVHKRITYLRHLIVSLAQARDISQTLLIFSHDFYDEEINELVQSIDFCKVMQIFYPFSIQMHPNEFPGTDPKDCKRDMKKDQALVTNCQNAQFPDLYGHYREASFTQTKHHWWWKANRVFDQLEATRYHTGLVLFLEEDHYVAEDFLHQLIAMQAAVPVYCPNCNVITLGKYDAELNNRTSDKVESSPWISSEHNMGMAFNRSTWNKLKSCSKVFCSFDDYNWDWSLQHASYQCMKSKLVVMAVQGPRVFHIGECGLHHQADDCDAVGLTKIQDHLKNVTSFMFPSNLTFIATHAENPFNPKANGGWADIRDITLCLSISLN